MGSRIVLDAAERECDIRLPGSLIGGSVGRKVAEAPRHHIRIQRFCNKKATTVAACSRASLVADIVDAVNIEAVGVEMLTNLQAADICGNGLVASLIRARIGIIFEILAEDSFRNRFFHRCIPAVLPEGYVYGDQRRLAAYGADADVTLHILIGDAVTVQNIAVAVGFIQLIRNHGFARNDTKGAVFRAFPAFLKPFHEMPKEKTVNLSIENAVLCFGIIF